MAEARIRGEFLDTATQSGRICTVGRDGRQKESEVIAIYQGAAAADPEAAAELRLALEGRRKGMEKFAATLAPTLRPGLEPDRAAAILQALTLAEVYEQLVLHSGWTEEEYQSWLEKALKRELLEG